MNPRRPSFVCHSFEDLEALLKSKSISLPDRPFLENESEGQLESAELEEDLFRKAMKGVRPISKDKVAKAPGRVDLPDKVRASEDADALEKLSNLVRYGIGFNVCDTAEYIEGTGYNVPSAIAKRLHRGDFSIQAHVDLHGLRVEDARETFDAFLHWAVTTGKRGVLIVHGRGLSSPAEPILKNKVKE